MPFWFYNGFNLTESEIRYVIDNDMVTTFRAAGEFLHCDQSTFVRYSKMYYDHETGLNLHQLFKKKKRELSKAGRPINKGYNPRNASLQDILDGKHPSYNPEKLQNRLIIEGVLLEQCNICGFNARRIKDFRVPLKLAWKDGNVRNHTLDNLELVCYNCFYLYHGEIFDKRYRVDAQMYQKNRELDATNK